MPQATGSRAGYILQSLADASKPFGIRVEGKGETGNIKLRAGSASGNKSPKSVSLVSDHEPSPYSRISHIPYLYLRTRSARFKSE